MVHTDKIFLDREAKSMERNDKGSNNIDLFSEEFRKKRKMTLYISQLAESVISICFIIKDLLLIIYLFQYLPHHNFYFIWQPRIILRGIYFIIINNFTGFRVNHY